MINIDLIIVIIMVLINKIKKKNYIHIFLDTRRLEEYRISNDTRSTKLDKKNMELDQKMVNLEQIKKEFENEMT